ncbi:hypothetical protein HZS_2177 [Henneguya salminicola]|nr:hypothetical protein HZS_2177 [Henneguya salminicola]
MSEISQESQFHKVSKAISDRSTSCPYLDTINRNMLDFDFEKLCSVSLTHLNVYACLVCGQYYQGRNKNSYAYLHSIELSHHVWINLSTLRFYCLPDNYEIIDTALNDIKNVLCPTFDLNKILALDDSSRMSRALDGTMFYPGLVGINNIRETDYMNVILHCLLFVKPLRNFFLTEENYLHINVSPSDLLFALAVRFGELARKVWNPNNFKAHVSPHEMVQAIVKVSGKKISIDKQADPLEFLSWFINNLHNSLNRDKSKKISIVKKTFQGKLQIYSKKIPMTDDAKEKKILLKKDEFKPIDSAQPFFFLSLDVPPPPLFTDPMEFNIIPQIALSELLCKYNGVFEKEYKTYKDFFIKRFIITKLPQYLIINIKRFSHNFFFKEKNPTLVNYPIKGLDLQDYVHPNYLSQYKSTTYNLISNVSVDHEPGIADRVNYFVHVLHKHSAKWFKIRDLQVTEVMPPMVSLSETYLQIWERNK